MSNWKPCYLTSRVVSSQERVSPDTASKRDAFVCHAWPVYTFVRVDHGCYGLVTPPLVRFFIMAAEWVLDEFGVAHFDESLSWLRQLQFSSEDTHNTVNTDTPCCTSSEGSGRTFSSCPSQTSPQTSDTHFEERQPWLRQLQYTSSRTQDQANADTSSPTESDETEVPISPCPNPILPAIRTPKRAIEYRPRHIWTPTQKKLLCSM